MCGITGYIGNHPLLSDEILRQMNRQIVRRGPDEDGFLVEPGVGLAMRRLSIQDLAGGHQPIFNEDQSVAIVFNGEIYNFPELRDDLIARGHRFQTHSDTEVIVHLYEEMGAACVQKLRGMFAFAIWDRRTGTALIARDRLGIKPLFYAQVDGALLFGSEIKTLLASGLVSRDLNPQAVDAFFTYTYIPAPLSIFRDIHKLPPGCLIQVDSGGMRVERYWDVDFGAADGTASEDEYASELTAELEDAVKCHLVADVEIGAFLSGGVDSGVVTAIASEQQKQPLKTFTIGFAARNNPLIDERLYAKEVAGRYGADYHELEVKPDFRAIADEIVHAFDEPFADDSVIPSYYVCEMTARKVKVALSGLGGDELFAGYFRYQGFALSQAYDKIPGTIKKYLIHPIVNLLPEPKSGSDAINHIKRFVNAGELPPDRRYLSYVSSLDESERAALYSPQLLTQIDLARTRETITAPFNRCKSKSLLHKAIYTDLHTYLPDDILALSDRLSMWHSLELRVPLIDHKLLEAAAKMPARMKLRRGKKKYLLKRVAERWLPNGVIYHKKQGFESPMGAWLRGELREYAAQLLDPERIKAQGLFNPEFVQQKLNEHLQLKRKNNKFLFSMIMFQLWWDRNMNE